MLFLAIACYKGDYMNLHASLTANGFILAPYSSKNDKTVGISCFDKLESQFAIAF
jgi:hypothetical protein